MFKRVLVANRGEIACRIIRTLKKMNIEAIAVFSEADRLAPHVLEADKSILIGPSSVRESYLNADHIFSAARECGAEAIHPGYGFLSENPEFAARCRKEGLIFIGPTEEHLRSFGLKHTARELARRNEVPMLTGTGILTGLEEARTEASRIGYPVMLKSTAGGGGIGMALCRNPMDLEDNFTRIERLGKNNFGSASLFLEKFVERARHVEVQIFGDGKGKALVLGDRDCSLQRRNQKVVEETPAPGLPDTLRTALHESALRLARAVNYRSAGTVEFILDARTLEFSFLEVNTRLQVEHTVTEETFGIDLVEWMILLAAGEMEDLDTLTPKQQGSAIQVRLYAEDPGKDFLPSGGLITEAFFPAEARVDSWISAGTEITGHYDPLLAKIIVKGDNREKTLSSMREILSRSRLAGPETNLDYLRAIFRLEPFLKGAVYTGLLSEMDYTIPAIDILSPGTATTLQDYPGRTGYWQVGVPPSGPMDSLSFRLGNRILENPVSAAGMEITLAGPVLTFRKATRICLTGAPRPARIGNREIPFYEPVAIERGETLNLGMISGPGQRTYLLIDGGFDVPLYLGSRSTFTLGVFGGHGGRVLKTGDVIRFIEKDKSLSAPDSKILPENLRPAITGDWEIKVLYGPQGAPDFFTQDDINTFFSTQWEVHYNSDRTGVRLIGPAPHWARQDGGEAGLHPSNIHDNAYRIGAVDFTGDMPVILGPDGPSLGGFVCPVTIIAADLWKTGQLKSGDRIHFKPVTREHAEALLLQQENFLTSLAEQSAPIEKPHDQKIRTPIIKTYPGSFNVGEAVCRQSGEQAVLLELGDPVLDIALRFQVHALMLHLEHKSVPGIGEMTPGIRSLQIPYDFRILPLEKLLDIIEEGLGSLAGCEELEIPSRIVYLPLSWDDEATRLAIEKYTTTVRPGAPWCPSNIEFIRRINGLDSTDNVKNILFDARYLVMGLGDVYLGAPVATPLDPRHRLVTTKYNPARTWTPENAVGIGGAYLCVYGMEGPGGYQFVGRTLQMWNRFNQTKFFTEGKPWLLRFFDQIRFYPVSHEELMDIRRDFPLGLYDIRVEESSFSLADYKTFLSENSMEIEAFRKTQREAFHLEREAWERDGQANFNSTPAAAPSRETQSVAMGCQSVETPVTGSVWKQTTRKGDRVKEGDPLVIMESMKTEISIPAPCSGIIEDIFCTEGDHIPSGGLLVSIRPMESPVKRSAS